jgi:hypothetical protein
MFASVMRLFKGIQPPLAQEAPLAGQDLPLSPVLLPALCRDKA